MDIKGIHLAWVTVADIKSAVDFYTKTMGFTLCEFHEQFAWAELIGKDGARLGLAQFNPDHGYKSGTNAIVTITVENIEKACAELKQKNVLLIGEILEIAGEVKMQTFADPDGNHFQLCQLLK